MNNRFGKKWPCIVLACLFALETAFFSLAAEGENAAAAARNGVVRILAVCEDACCWTGSGFGVGKAGEETDIFVTNWHVAVQPCEHGANVQYVLILLDDHAVNYMNLDFDRMVQCKMVETTTGASGIPDFAVIQAERKVPGRVALPLLPRDQCSVSDRVFAMGFPGTGDLANNNEYIAAEVSEVTSTEGTISRMLDDFAGLPYEVIQHTAHINHGNSGGPLITETGAVIGLNTYGYGDGAVSADAELNPDEYSVAVSIDYVIKALDKHNLPYDIYSEPVKKSILPWAVIFIAVLLVAAMAIFLLKKKGQKPQAAASQGAQQPYMQPQQPQYAQPQQPQYAQPQQPQYAQPQQPQYAQPQQPQYAQPQQSQYAQPQQSQYAQPQQSQYAQPQQPQYAQPQQQPQYTQPPQPQLYAQQHQRPQASPVYRQAVPASGYGQQTGSAASQLKLKGTKGCFDGRIFAFSKDRYQFGTDGSCQLKYPAGTPGIGPVHCELLIQNGSFYLVDLGSQYGTYVNSRKITPNQSYPLKEGDTICLASAQEAFQVVNN